VLVLHFHAFGEEMAAAASLPNIVVRLFGVEEVALRLMLRLRPDQAGEALNIDVKAGETGEIADDAGQGGLRHRLSRLFRQP
jgi:hypothetical protein